jgi:1-deoxy-D-xylulose-5-phosphate synthase
MQNKSILETISSPKDLKKLSHDQLTILASEIRKVLITTVSRNGGHLASSLGVVELTIALHRIFHSPEDKIIWDVGHQSYAHKLLTGRKDDFSTLRTYGGISGFPVRTESEHDAFGAGHAGTSISAALGMALARDESGNKNHVIAVIGDGSLGAGMALEAINHAGHLGTRVIVVLNDNGMSISPSVGAVSRILNQIRFSPRYEKAKKLAKRKIIGLPMGKFAWGLSKRMTSQFEGVIIPNFWEQMGFTYLGPVDGHNEKEIEAALIRASTETGPTLVHVITQKGKGCAEAEADATKFHGVAPYVENPDPLPSYSQIFGQTIERLMKDNEKIVAISAAMLDGTGLAPAAKLYPKRVFDVGICEQHAVTLAAGLATGGFIPIVAIYSTFLQRSYDQIIHDVCLQNLPVIFAVDRAGIVGDDGKTHQGSFDITFLRSIPNMVLAAPKDEIEFQHLLFSAVKYGKPTAIRYPRGNGGPSETVQSLHLIPAGNSEMLRKGNDLAILAIGATVFPALEVAGKLAAEGIQCTVINARFAKPLDINTIIEIAGTTGRVITVEENSLIGGFGSAVLELLSQNRIVAKVECIGLPDNFIEHGSQELLRTKYELDTTGIINRVRRVFPELFTRSSTGGRR